MICCKFYHSNIRIQAILTKLVYCILFIFAFHAGNNKILGQQYVWTKKSYIDSYPIEASNIGKSFIKGYANNIRLYNLSSDTVSVTMIIQNVNLNTLSVNQTDTIKDINLNFFYKDIIASTNYNIFIGNSRLFINDKKNNKNIFIDNDTIEYNNGYIVNDSTLFLSKIYNFHPLNAYPGMYFSLLNLNSMKVTRYVKNKFKGVALSHMISDWSHVDKNNIYIVTPLSGILYKYNLNFELVDTVILPVNWANYDRNIRYETFLDSLTNNSWLTVDKIRKKYGADSVRNNLKLPVWYQHSKEFMDTIIRTTRGNYDYIEKLIPFNDSIFIICLNRAGYDLLYRDALFYNINTNKIVARKDRWLCGKVDTLNSFEDLFPVDLINSKPFIPYFYNNKIYSLTYYNPSLYQSGTYNAISKILYNDVVKNGFRCYILEYELL